METKQLWKQIEKAAFMAKLVSEVVIFPHIPMSANEFKIGQEECSGKFKCKVGRYEYEFSNVGAYRFRDINCGPWTAWRCCEGS